MNSVTVFDTTVFFDKFLVEVEDIVQIDLVEQSRNNTFEPLTPIVIALFYHKS